MSKPLSIIPSRQLNVALPLPVFTRLMLHLNSDLEGRVPHGAYSRFLTDILRERFDEAQLDLAPFLHPESPSGTYVVRGEPATIQLLEQRLHRDSFP